MILIAMVFAFLIGAVVGAWWALCKCEVDIKAILEKHKK